MKLDIAQLARDKGVRRKTVPLRPIAPTAVLENDLFAIYALGLNVWAQAIGDIAAAYLPPAIADTLTVTIDADGTQIQWLVDQAASHADSTLVYQTERLGRWVTRTGQWHGAKTISGIKSALGVDIAPFVRLGDVQNLLDTSIAQNVALIRDVNAKTRSQIEAAIFDAFAQRRPKKELTDKLAAIMGTTKVRARNIAGDQMHKLSIALTGYRNQQLGIASYMWVTMHDDRVRPAHRARDGMAFRWDAPPFDGPPGYPPMCRCHARPMVEL